MRDESDNNYKMDRSDVLKLKGTLNLKHDNDDYVMFTRGRSENISETLNIMLLSDVFIEVRHTYSGKVLFSESGKLIKEKTAPCYYQYYVNEVNLDEVLWNNVGNKLEIEVRNTTKTI